MPPPIHSTCPSYHILLDFITRTIFVEQYRSLSSSLCSFLHSPVTSTLLGPNILLNTLFSNTLSLRSSLNVRDQVSHPYKTTGKIIILYILISKFFCLEYWTTGIYVLNRVPRHDNVYWRRGIARRVLSSILDETIGYLQVSALYSQGKGRRYLLNWRQSGSQSRY